jgi:FAD/FMN-containing dehydrogenase
MTMPPNFPHTHIKALDRWSNYSGTIDNRAVPLFCTPNAPDDAAPASMVAQGESIRAILQHCFSQPDVESVRAIGSRWSFSRLIEPGRVIIDTPNLNVVLKVSPQDLTDGYRAVPLASGRVPVFVQGGTTISALNRRLGQIGLALQTSGAGDGHRIAGCIATGTHGSALQIGAVHDTVLGVHLVVAPDRAFFVQPQSMPSCSDSFADWLTEQTGIPTTMLASDDAYSAAIVSLGSLGFVFGVVIETVPLYRLARKTLVLDIDNAALWGAIRSLDTSPLHPERAEAAYHFDVVMHPYAPQGGIGAYATVLWKEVAQGPFASPDPAKPDASSDAMGWISGVANAVGGVLAPLTTLLLREVIGAQLASRFQFSDGTQSFPGQIFGPTTLPPGAGASTEIVLDLADAENAIHLIRDVLAQNASQGRHLLGAIGVRFVPQTRSLLGMNVARRNCYIELPSIRNNDVLHIYRDCWSALRNRGIRFTCHWGQLHGLGAEQVSDYFGDRVARWKAVRTELLGAQGRQIFAAPLLAEVGLD